jgi:hypothetical protein
MSFRAFEVIACFVLVIATVCRQWSDMQSFMCLFQGMTCAPLPKITSPRGEGNIGSLNRTLHP